MKSLKDNNEILQIIKENKMVVVYFTGKDCGACEAIKIKVEQILNRYSKILGYEINGEEEIELCTKFEAFSLPLFLLFTDGKESLRVSRHVDLFDLENKIKRYYELIFD